MIEKMKGYKRSPKYTSQDLEKRAKTKDEINFEEWKLIKENK